MKRKNNFEKQFLLSDDKMKNIVGGFVPPGGGCKFAGSPCGPSGVGGCIAVYVENGCCCSMDSGNSDCEV